MPQPQSIKKTGPKELTVEWNDGHRSVYTFEWLRDRCPCAGCAGESILFQHYVPPPPDKSTPGRYELKSIETVGSYAVQIYWGDGHATGIYTWEHLLKLCPCPQHASGNAV